jgi:hypothetical protein
MNIVFLKAQHEKYFPKFCDVIIKTMHFSMKDMKCTSLGLNLKGKLTFKFNGISF